MFTDFLYQHLQGVLYFTGAQLLVGLANITGMRQLNSENPDTRRRGRSPGGAEALPYVSILVPARNEAGNIEACARSLLEQEYLGYELIVLDDQSQDGTGEILKRMKADQPHISVLEGQPLPKGWVGKTWACHQLAEAAAGDYLLFTDADTRHHPEMLADVMSYMTAHQMDFLTGMPRQELRTWGERLVVPFLSWIIFAFVPISLAKRVRSPIFSAAVGQFMLFRREAYQKIGGHSLVRHSSLEDILLARQVARQGLSWDFMDLSERVVCRMYPDFRSAFNGIAKNLFGVFQYNLPVFSFVWIWLLLVYVEPFVLILAKAAGILVPEPVFGLALASAGLSLLLWGLNNLKFRMPLIQAALYPVTVVLLFIMAVRSAWYYYTRRPFDWKGRDLPLSE